MLLDQAAAAVDAENEAALADAFAALATAGTRKNVSQPGSSPENRAG